MNKKTEIRGQELEIRN